MRRLIGHDRLDTHAQQAWLDAFYPDDLRPFANCFQSVMKLVGKETVGQRTRRYYDTPKTPLRRLLDDYSGHVDLDRLRALTDLYTAVSPLTLKRASTAALPSCLFAWKSTPVPEPTYPQRIGLIHPFAPNPPALYYYGQISS